MRILITGGFGFIGGRLAVHLAQSGHEIILGTRRITEAPIWLPQAQVVKIEWDIKDSLERACAGADVVIHAAGMNAKDCAMASAAALQFNGLATARLVEAAVRVTVKRIVYISTAHVYASPLTGVITEDTCPRNLHPYATSHLAGENAVLYANASGKIQGILLRLANAFGAPVDKEVDCWKLVVNDLCRQSLQTGKMVLSSNGQQERNFVAMEDVCRIIAYFSTCESGASFPVFNVGSGSSKSILNIAKLIQERCQSIFRFTPELQKSKDQEGRAGASLHFRSDKISSFGLKVGQDPTHEIDSLLNYCQSTFLTTFNPTQ